MEQWQRYRSDAEIEATLDSRIQRRLATDAAYRNAADAEAQSAREYAIEREESERLANEVGHSLDYGWDT